MFDDVASTIYQSLLAPGSGSRAWTPPQTRTDSSTRDQSETITIYEENSSIEICRKFYRIANRVSVNHSLDHSYEGLQVLMSTGDSQGLGFRVQGKP